MKKKLNIISISLLLTFETPLPSAGAIIPPTWANPSLNPCAKLSWQLIHWPPHDRCYNIFTQGPCQDTEELFFDEEEARASCRCSKGKLWHPQTSKCYVNYSKGPCGRKEYFGAKESREIEVKHKPEGYCLKYEECPPGHLFWPPTKECYPHLSKGPCLDGSLLFINPKSDLTECGCSSDFMSTNYWRHGQSCHELFTQGPCIDGHVFIYNLTTGSSECTCEPHLVTNFHKPTERCYELKKLGPCSLGQIFIYNSDTRETQCTCLPGYIKWKKNGNCFRAYTRGPCPAGNFFYPKENNKEHGICLENFCQSGELYHPDTKLCYSIGKRGPCVKGKLWVYERAISIRGLCQCDPNLVGYWEPHGICYEIGQKGPCGKHKVLSYNKNNSTVQCKCDISRGYVLWNKEKCIKIGSYRNKIFPIAQLRNKPARLNTILRNRMHRGLLPPLQRTNFNGTYFNSFKNISQLQQEILRDVMAIIRQNNTNYK